MARRYDCSDASDRANGLREAASAVRRGELVVLPTDTVYGIGADAFNAEAVGDLLQAKGRGRNMPSPVLVGSPNTLHGLLTDTGPMAVSSANLTGHPSPQDCDAAERMLGDSVSVYLDGGPTPAAVPSSIVDVTGKVPVLLRAGALTAEQLREVVPDLEES